MRKKPMFLGTKDAANKLKISQQYLRKLLSEDIIKGQFVGKSYVINVEEDSFKHFKRQRRQKRKAKNS